MSEYLTYSVFIKFLKFGAVGISGMAVDFGTTYLLKEKLHTQKYIANSVGFVVAASSNYLLNRVWTFQSHDPEVFLQFSKFIGISVIGLLLNNFIIFLLNDRFKLNFYLSKLAAIGVVVIWNFFANYLYTFSSY